MGNTIAIPRSEWSGEKYEIIILSGSIININVENAEHTDIINDGFITFERTAYGLNIAQLADFIQALMQAKSAAELLQVQNDTQK